MVYENEPPTVPVALVALVITGAAPTVKGSLKTLAPFRFVAVIVAVKEPEVALGVPDNNPELLSERPPGNPVALIDSNLFTRGNCVEMETPETRAIVFKDNRTGGEAVEKVNANEG